MILLKISLVSETHRVGTVCVIDKIILYLIRIKSCIVLLSRGGQTFILSKRTRSVALYMHAKHPPRQHIQVKLVHFFIVLVAQDVKCWTLHLVSGVATTTRR